ncbi:MAG: histidine kinase [Acidimicrobiia bacterium]
MTHRLLIWTLAAFTVAGFVATMIISPFARSVAYWPWLLAPVIAAPMSALILTHSQGNLLGRLMMAASLLFVGSILAWSVVDITGTPEQSAWAEAVFTMGGLVGGLLVPFIILRFPDGKPITRRWRIAEGIAIAAMVIGSLATLLNGGWGGDVSVAERPSPLRAVTYPMGDILAAVFTPLLLATLTGAAVSIFIRYRRSAGEARQQLKFLMVAAAVAFAGAVAAGGTFTQAWENLVGGLGFTMIPVAVAVAILKFRLFDIDVVISRTLVYGLLALFIGGVYVAIVVGVGGLVGGVGEGDTVLSVVATAVVAIGFQGVRRWLERLANRLVFGRRASPYQVLSDFSRRLAATDEGLIDQVARSLADGTSAQSAAVWVRVGDGFERSSVWPPDGEAVDPVPVGVDESPVDEIPGVDRTVWVTHDGERLGALTLTFPRGQAPTSVDDRLLAELAAGMGLALRNAVLTQSLRDRIAELRESRRRIVAVQDQTRRRLERDLHDGAQQQLVALKVKLALARRLAANGAAPRTSEVLEGLNSEAEAAIQSMRDFARGIYPPLLESEGLAAAVGAHARKCPIPVSVEVGGIGRFGQQTEATVYFCIVEALANTVKHARASSAHVTLGEADGHLTFTVADDGTGFDSSGPRGHGLTNISDRLDAAGGSLHLHTTPGGGTTLTGRLPTHESITV